MTPETNGTPSKVAVWGPTWPVSLSAARVPKKTNPKGARRPMAAASTRAVTRVSEPARAGSLTRTAASAPMAWASASASTPTAGPMERAVTVPPRISLTRRAASRAGRSKGLSSLFSGVRRPTPSAALRTTDLMHTMLLTDMAFSLRLQYTNGGPGLRRRNRSLGHWSGGRPHAPAAGARSRPRSGQPPNTARAITIRWTSEVPS